MNVADVGGRPPGAARTIEVVGAMVSGASTVHRRTSGVWSNPVGVAARTLKECEPAGNGEYVCGEVHGRPGPLSSWHVKVAPAMSDENVKVAVVSLVVPVGPERIVVSGLTLSSGTPHCHVA
jgi:hypothetical protein